MLKVMRKITFFACTALLASAVVLPSCKNDKDEPQGRREVVKTEFAISMPQQLSNNNTRRMPSTTVQRDGLTQFQGMTGITLVPFDVAGAITSSDARLGSNVVLVGGVSQSEIDRPSSAKVFTDVEVPMNTASFLFYAVSAAGNGGANSRTVAEKFSAGSLIGSNLTANTPASITFDLEPIVSNVAAMTASNTKGDSLLTYLTSIARASDGDPSTPKMWYEYTAGDDATIAGLFTTYSAMHWLSSFGVERALTDLYKSLMPLSSDIATAIKTAINNSDYATVNGSTGVVTLKSCVQNFPEAYNLPTGSIDLAWDGTTNHEFKIGNYDGKALPSTYVYPAQLWYYVNSQVKTSTTSKQTMYDNTNDWATILAAHTASPVTAATRAVAIINPVQYAVARLDVSLKLDAASLADNSESATGVATPVNCASGFPVKAILVGGQKHVGFNFEPISGTEYTIYDTVMTEAITAAYSASVYSAVNHTLVLENGNENVNVAVEMVNNTGSDFYGAGNQLIPKNGKFYVIAQLKVAEPTVNNVAGHVFKQDYYTTARLNLKTLKSAYNTLPDLRTPQLELGFSVDLTWQAGNQYDVDIP